MNKLVYLFDKIRHGDIDEEYQSLLPLRRKLRSDYDSENLQELYMTTFREIWLKRMSKAPSVLSPSSTKAAGAIRDAGGSITKREMMRVVGWGGLDWYYGLRYRLLMNGFRTRIENDEVVWFEYK
jgi:hypothetical protein